MNAVALAAGIAAATADAPKTKYMDMSDVVPQMFEKMEKKLAGLKEATDVIVEAAKKHARQHNTSMARDLEARTSGNTHCRGD